MEFFNLLCWISSLRVITLVSFETLNHFVYLLNVCLSAHECMLPLLMLFYLSLCVNVSVFLVAHACCA